MVLQAPGTVTADGQQADDAEQLLAYHGHVPRADRITAPISKARGIPRDVAFRLGSTLAAANRPAEPDQSRH